MLISQGDWSEIAFSCGADGAGTTAVENIPFRREFREACEQNTCGKFGRCWMCPPDVGDIDAMIAQAGQYSHALVFQTIGRLEDSFDIEGMQAAAKRHNQVTVRIAERLTPLLGGDIIKLAAGACHICEECEKRFDRPCRYPDKALPSLEAYGIAVSELAPLCGLKYVNGQNTVTYFGGFLYGRM